MTIKGPKGAIPTPKGWVHPRTGELLKSVKYSQQQIDEWHGIESTSVIQTLHEAPVVEQEITEEIYDFHYKEGFLKETEEE